MVLRARGRTSGIHDLPHEQGVTCPGRVRAAPHRTASRRRGDDGSPSASSDTSTPCMVVATPSAVVHVFDRLHELAHQGPVLPGEDADRERPALARSARRSPTLALDPVATNFGLVATWETQLQVMRFRRSPERLPTT